MSADIVAADQLKAIVQRVERLEAEIADLNADKSEIYKEARANGFDVKVIKKVVSKRKIDEHERVEQDHVFDLYWDAVHGLNLVHAHARENIEQFSPSDGSPSVSSSLTTREAEESVVSNSPQTANETPKQVYGDSVGRATARPSQSVDIPATGDQGHEIDGSNDRCPGEPHSEKATVATQGEATGPTSGEREDCAAANAGGDNVERSGLPAGLADPTSNTGEGAANIALPAKSSIRPLCRNPGETCGGYGRKHCRACETAAAELDAAE